MLRHDIEVTADRFTTVALDSGVRLVVADWIPSRDPQHGWWGVAEAGAPSDARLHWTRSEETLLLPPGQYDVYWVQDRDHSKRPLLLASGVDVNEHALVIVPANAGLQLNVAAETPALDPDHGWWGIVPAGYDAAEPLNWARGRFDQPLLVRPGTYDIVWKQGRQHQPERVVHGVVIGEDELVRKEVQRPEDATSG